MVGLFAKQSQEVPPCQQNRSAGSGLVWFSTGLGITRPLALADGHRLATFFRKGDGKVATGHS